MLRIALLLCSLPLVFGCGYLSGIAWLGIDDTRPSRCFGGDARGRLTDGRRLAYSGDNYRAYSLAGFLLGRTFVHSAVRDTIRDAYAELARSRPDLRFVYAESGWPNGGRFAPHQTPRNGTAMDFLVPVRTADGRVAEVPTTLFNDYGYSITFDEGGRHEALKVDFDAMALHLLALDTAARRNGIAIRRVLFDVGLQKPLHATTHGTALKERIRLNEAQTTSRHDQHYHVEFAVTCEP